LVNFEVSDTIETISLFGTQKADRSAKYGLTNQKKKFLNKMLGFIKTHWISLDLLFDFTQERIPCRK
jgi:hypothetical protein